MPEIYKHPGGKLRRLGANSCSDRDLLAIILNTGTSKYSAEKISEMVFEKFGSLNNLMGKRLSELIEIEGIGEVKATQIAALFELTKRIIKKLETE